MAISYSLTEENEVKITNTQEAISTEKEQRDAFTESRILGSKEDVLEGLTKEKKQAEDIIASYTKKRDDIVVAMTSIEALVAN